MKHVSRLLVAAALAASLPAAVAQPASAPETSTSQAAALADGEVRKVDMEAKKLTLRHGPLANLDMPSMTMVFQVKDPALLEKVKAGDKVRFAADKINGAFTVTSIEVAK